jgi:hypothetical protein
MRALVVYSYLVILRSTLNYEVTVTSCWSIFLLSQNAGSLDLEVLFLRV